jgi:putative heme-binding domain-containing protein
MDARERLFAMITDEATPLGLRRVALRTYGSLNEGPQKLLEMARAGKVPEVLRGEATSVLHGHPDRRIRDEAVRLLPLTSATGRPLPPPAELLRREGDTTRGRQAFFKVGPATQAGGVQACSACHRVQGRGQWVGPDLSTIGTKYGPDELLRSVLNPSAAIGYNYVTTVLAMKDGQVITGLPVEDTPERLVLKTAEGRRVAVRPGDVEERATSEVSLMPEGLAQTMTEEDLVDLLAFLGTLKRPVSVVGQFQAIGPTADAVESTPPAGRDRKGRAVTADAEGRIDLGALAGADAGKTVYLSVPITAPVALEATLVLDTRADLRAWLKGKALELPALEGDGTRSIAVTLPKGTSELLLRVPCGQGDVSLVATIVADRPVEFSTATATGR